MATDNALKTDILKRAKALEDWAILTIGNTARLSPEAEEALRHQGTKGLRGRAFTLTVGEEDLNAALVIHGRIEGILLSENRPLRTVILTSPNLISFDDSGFKDAVLAYSEDMDVNENTGWVLGTDYPEIDAFLADVDKPDVLFEIE